MNASQQMNLAQDRVVQPQFQSDEKLDEAEEKRQEVAFQRLRADPRFNNRLMEHFEYDPVNHVYKEKRRRHARFTPYPTTHAHGYHIVGARPIEEMVEYAPMRHIEPFVRRDTQDVIDRHRRKFYSGMDGRAHNYLAIGPWIKLRLLKSTIHITLKGRPPIKAFEILAKHMAQQIKTAISPRIIMPNRLKKVRKYMITVATPQVLKKMGSFELVSILRKSLQRKLHHIIYRQTNIGGILFDLAAKEDTLY